MTSLPAQTDPTASDEDEVLTGKVGVDPDDVESSDLEPYDEDEDEERPDVAPDLRFTTKAKDRKDDQAGEELHMEIDGEIYTAVRPAESAFIFVSTAGARSTPTAEKMKAIIEFIGEAFTEESGVRLRDRLLDKTDEFEFDDLLPILRVLARKWSKGKPKMRNARDRRRR